MNQVAHLIPNHPAECRGVSSREWQADGSQCRLCWLATYDERYRIHWGISDGGKAKASSLACQFRGPAVANVIPGKGGCQCQHGPSVYECRAHDAHCVVLEPDWSGATVDPVRLPTQMFRWRTPREPSWVTVRSCVGCQARQAAESAAPFRFTSIAVAVTTAPRQSPRLQSTLDSLLAAGFGRGEVMIFAEPDSPVPDGWWSKTSDTKLGVTANWRRALNETLHAFPDADTIAMFQDDVQVAADLKDWLLETSVPADAAFVSPYCPASYTPRDGRVIGGLLNVTPGTAFGMVGGGLIGAVTLVFPRASAELLASDALFRQDNRKRHLDAAIGHWTQRVSRRCYFAHPSRAWHTGDTSTIHIGLGAVGHRQAASVEFVTPRKTARDPDNPRVGVIGFNTASGLGTLAREAARNLPNVAMLGVRHKEFAPLTPPIVDYAECHADDELAQSRFIASVDVVLTFERMIGNHVTRIAKQLGVPTACVVMHEYVPVGGNGHLADVDVLICPNGLCRTVLEQDCDRRRLISCDWPIDVARIPFRQRKIAETFLFCQGTGGVNDRKGGAIVAAAAELLPDVPFVVRTQLGDKRMRRQATIHWPRNVTVLGMTDEIEQLYALGDVAVQPSRYEGVGLQLVEAQAAGLPLITTNARPMSDCLPWKVVEGEPRQVMVQRPTVSTDLSPSDVARVIESVRGRDIVTASQMARDNAMRLYSWESRKNDVLAVIKQVASVLG